MMKIIYLVLLVISLGTGALSFFISPEYRWILWIVLWCLIIVIIGLSIYAVYKLKKIKQEKETEQDILLRQDKEVISELFKLSIKVLKNDFLSYRIPVYINIGTNSNEQSLILEQNDFNSVLDDKDITIKIGKDVITNESDSYLKFWHNDSAIVIQVGHRIFDEDGADSKLWEFFASLLYKYRGQQVCNGIIYTLGCSFIQTGDQDYHERIMNGVRNDLLSFNRYVGINIPVYLSLSNADCINDFVTFFKIFEGKNLERPLGFTIKNKDRRHFDFKDYEAKVKEFIEYFSINSIKFLKNLDEEKSRAILSFPYQISLFFNLLEENLRILSKENKLKQSVWIRGVFFLVPNQTNIRYDLLTQLIALKADFDTDAQMNDMGYDKKRFFVQKLFSESLLPEFRIVGVNRKKKILDISMYFLKLSCIVAIVVYSFMFYYQNWCDYKDLRGEVVKTVDEYKRTIDYLDLSKTNTLDDVVLALNKLRNLSIKLDKNFNILKVVSYEQYQLPNHFRKFYEDELKAVLLRKVELAIRESLYNLENMDNMSSIYNGAGAYMMLFDKSIIDEQYFLDYLYSEVLPYQEFDQNLKLLLESSCHDLFATDYDKSNIKEDLQLVEALKHRMDIISADEMLYELVKLNKQNSRKINLLEQFGKYFHVLFSFNPEYTGYKMPYMYTREGFLSIDLSIQSPELKRLLKNLRLIKSNIDLSDDGIKDVIQKVRKQYYSDYTDKWNDLLQNLNVNGFSSFDEVHKSLDFIIRPKNGALEGFMRTLVNNTYLTNAYKSETDETNQNTKDVTVDKDILNGDIIASEFENYYSFIGVNDSLEYSANASVPYNILNKKLGLISSDYKLMSKAGEGRNKTVFTHVTKNLLQDSSDYDLMSIIDDETPLLFDNIITSLQNSCISAITFIVDDYIKGKWNNDIIGYYNEDLKNRFPFDLDSDKEVSIAKFNKMFGEHGLIEVFYDEYLKYFVEETNEKGYRIKENGLFFVDIPYFILDQIAVVQTIQEVLSFNDSKQLKIKLIPRKLSGNAKLFEYSDGVNNCTYNQGPRQPCLISWPINSQSNVVLKFIDTKKSYSHGQSYNTEWGIIKAFSDKEHSNFSNVLYKGSQAWIFTVDDYKIVYDVQIEGMDNKVISLDLIPRLQFFRWK
ncbi:MAG: type VI secretion protein IcmF/TssM N-terminal domain-containing protein [Succinivibrionaceae bacterium]